MKNPLISLVIPTRERCDTLKYTLQTALNQKSQNYEIVISDNFSQDDTKKIVDSFDDPRIKYFNTRKRLSMCENWDFACENTRGEFIIIIGDDDGVFPGRIDFLEAFIEKHPADIYLWNKHIYTWPNEEKLPEINQTAVRQKHISVDLQKMARSSIRWGANNVAYLPKAYHSAISKAILSKIKETTGKIFHSVCPDIFSAFALPAFANKAINVGRGVTAYGRSPKANSGGEKEVVERFLKEFGNYQCHTTLEPCIQTHLYYFVDSALVAMELFPDFYKNIEFNYSAMWAVSRKSIGKTILDLFTDRNKIREHHPFFISVVIYYSFAHRILIAKRKLLEGKSRVLRRKLASGPLPNNILEFVNLLSEV